VTLVTLYRVYTRALGRAYGVAARPDFIAAVAAMLGVLVFDTLPGLFIGIAISLTLLLYRVSRPRVAVLGRVPGTRGQYGDVERHPENAVPDAVVVLRPESGLFFANAEHVRDTVRAHVGRDTGAVVLDAETVPYIDVSAARMLGALADDLARDGVVLVLARDIGQVRDVLHLAEPGHAPVHAFPTGPGGRRRPRARRGAARDGPGASPVGVRNTHPRPP
jgi:SulP family sulfate permease